MAGVRMVEVAQFTFTPAAGAVLADWGAEVIKIEHPVMGDAQRGLRLGLSSSAEGSFSPIMEHPNRGKRSIGLALDRPEGLAILHELVRSADLFLTNFLPDARTRLRIDVDDLRAINPQLIYVRGSAFGPHGPDAAEGGYDATAYWARSGSALGVTPPGSDYLLPMPAPAYGDSVGGITIAAGIAAALFARAQTGDPSVVDVSLLSTGAWAMGLAVDIALLTGEPMTARPITSYGAPANPLSGSYRTADGRWLTLTMLQPTRYWDDFCRAIERPDLATDERWDTGEKLMANAPAAAEEIAAIIGSKSLAHWQSRLSTMDGPWSPVQSALELAHDTQLRANGQVAKVTDADGNDRELLANPVLFDEKAPTLRRAPLFAEHTDEILVELGYDMDAILQLKIDGVVT
jgi:crotonobetainyl-CoA:carnitine CoA-transferase CaiB-like acyl-CoA transferase